MKKVLAFVAVVMLFTLTSCGTIYLDTRELPQPVQMNSAGMDGYTVVSEFLVKDKAGWVWIVPVNKPAGDKQDYFRTIINEQISSAGGDGVMDVTIKTQGDIIDFLTSVVTLGLYNTRTVVVEGKVVKKK